MKYFLTTKNNKPVSISDIPLLDEQIFHEKVCAQVADGMRVISFFGASHTQGIQIIAILAHDETSEIHITSMSANGKGQYRSLAPECPSFHIFERELWEQTGIEPVGHPWLKPVRYAFDRSSAARNLEFYPFFAMQGDEVHEVAVGPVHAGVIEPGHFRFQCNGEDVYHLEIQLGYQHRGVEHLFLQGNPLQKIHLAESIAGDTVIGHAIAYASAMESLASVEVSNRAEAIRSIALELERTGVHIGDLGAIANDVAYMMGQAVFGALRTLVINTSLALCGSRFGRGLVRLGGAAHDITSDLADQMRKTLIKVRDDVERMSDAMFSSASVLSRLEKTGIVDEQTARAIGMVGMAARASGISMDVRTDHPHGLYRSYPVHKITMKTGDVFARAYIRHVEIQQSIKLILEMLDNLPPTGTGGLMANMGSLAPEKVVVSMTEGWRGEIVHVALTDAQGGLLKYKIKDPSFQNWFGLALAVRNNGISDFPLCNKSFNLSYCGNDL